MPGSVLVPTDYEAEGLAVREAVRGQPVRQVWDHQGAVPVFPQAG